MSKETPFTLNGWHVLAGFIAFFGVIIAVNIAFVIFASRSFPGESVERPYEKGLRYNQTLAMREQAIEENWQARFEIDNKETVVVHITNSDGPVDGLAVSVRLFWPGLPDKDQHLKLLPFGPGQYRISLEAQMMPDRAMEFEGQAVRTNDEWVFPFTGRL